MIGIENKKNLCTHRDKVVSWQKSISDYFIILNYFIIIIIITIIIIIVIVITIISNNRSV